MWLQVSTVQSPSLQVQRVRKVLKAFKTLSEARGGRLSERASTAGEAAHGQAHAVFNPLRTVIVAAIAGIYARIKRLNPCYARYGQRSLREPATNSVTPQKAFLSRHVVDG